MGVVVTVETAELTQVAPASTMLPTVEIIDAI